MQRECPKCESDQTEEVVETLKSIGCYCNCCGHQWSERKHERLETNVVRDGGDGEPGDDRNGAE